MGGKKFVNSNIDMISMEQPEYSESQNKKDRRPTPYKIQVRTQTQNISLDNTYTHQKPNVGTSQTPESLRDISQTSNSLNLNESYHLLDDSLSQISHGSSDDNQYSLSGQDISQHSQGAAAITTSADNTSHINKYPMLSTFGKNNHDSTQHTQGGTVTVYRTVGNAVTTNKHPVRITIGRNNC